MFCGNCGNQVNEGTRFCPKCGQPIAQAAPTNTPAPSAGVSNQTPAPISAPYNQSYYSPGSNYPNGAGGASDGKGLQVASLVLGIIGLIISFFGTMFGVVGFLMGIVAVICAASGMKKAGMQPHGMATAGLVCGILAIVFGLGSALCWGLCIGAGAGTMSLLGA